MKTVIVIVLGLLASSCAKLEYAYVAPPQSTAACPQERVYTDAERRQLKKEFDRVSPGIRGMLMDYSELRHAAQACREVEETQ